jgi:hypothetical protein
MVIADKQKVFPGLFNYSCMRRSSHCFLIITMIMITAIEASTMPGKTTSSSASHRPNNVLMILGITCLIGSSLLGFPVVETLRQTVTEIDPLEKLVKTWWVQAYMLLLPVGMSFLAFSFHTPWALFPLLAFLTVPLLLNYIVQIIFDLEEFYASPKAFGIRGTIIAVGIFMTFHSLLFNNNEPSRLYHFISQCCFALAAWNCCALGSFIAWTAHPEYGEFAQAKRDQLAAIQLNFIVGFATAAMAYRIDYSNHSYYAIMQTQKAK